jgi:tRNA(adenine34) deaminase
MSLNHERYMQLAIDQAVIAGDKNEVPVGAVLISSEGEVLAAAHNGVIEQSDPTAHAEIQVLRHYSRQISNYRLLNTTLYATIEPCLMCMGAIIHARVAKVVFGAGDAKWGAAGSLYDFAADRRLNHHPEIVSGVSKEACRVLIQDFFRTRRKDQIKT